VRNVLKGFTHKKSILKNLQNKLNEEMDLGLALNPSRKSSLIMANTYVTKLPDRSESGDFISLDLGTTNFRVVLSQFRPQSENVFKVKHYTVPNQYRRGESKNVSNYLIHQI
jgi:hexokinase